MNIRSTGYRSLSLVALALALFGASAGGCVVEDEEDMLDDGAALETRSNPGAGTGSATWTVQSVPGGPSLTFTVGIDDGETIEPALQGTEPAFEDLPMVVTNADGEDLLIEKVAIDGNTYRKYSGKYTIVVDSDASAATCTECTCWGGNCIKATVLTDCSSTPTTCQTWPCGGGGGGITKLDLDFSSIPGAPV